MNNKFGMRHAECGFNKSKIQNLKSKIGKYRLKISFLLLFFICLFLTGSLCCGRAACAAHFTLTVAHVNDTHGHLQPVPVNLVLDATAVSVDAGGFPRLAAKVSRLRAANKNFLLLHAGDVFQGTLFFTKYQGLADVELLNSMRLDALCPGNHEFDKGVETLAAFLRQASFPAVAANMNVVRAPVLREKIVPYVIKQFGQERVGIIGLASPETPFISNPGAGVRFFDPAAAAQQSIAALAREGINKIIILSHLGFDRDRELAAAVDGIDLIVGGHTHTLLGDFERLGLEPEGAYPHAMKSSRGETVLIVQAWEWTKVLGVLHLEFNESGQVTGYTGTPVILTGSTADRGKGSRVKKQADNATRKKIFSGVRQTAGIEIVEEDTTIAGLVRYYAAPIEALYGKVVATAADALPHVRRPDIRNPAGGTPSMSLIAPLVADAMLWKCRQTGHEARIAILNGGAVSGGLSAGDISAGQAYDLLPYSNQLVVLELTGGEIRKALAAGVARAYFRRGRGGSFPYVGGLCYGIRVRGGRAAGIADITVQESGSAPQPLRDQQTYRVIMNEYIARGGDGYSVFARAQGARYNTGCIDAEVFQDYARSLGTLRRPAEQRITFINESK
jgi:5'-nucleotidase